MIEVCNDRTCEFERMLIVYSKVIGHSAGAAMQICAAEFLGSDHLSLVQMT